MIIGTVVLTLIVAGLVMLFAVKMRAGRSWARIVLTVFGIVTTLVSASTLVTLAGSRPGGQDLYSGAGGMIRLILTVLPTLLVLVALVLQWLPAARRHFE